VTPGLIPIPAGAREQIAAEIERAAGLDALNDLSAAERDDAELDDQQQYAQHYAGLVRSWPAASEPPAEPELADPRAKARESGEPHRIKLAATAGDGGPFEHRELRLAALDAGGVGDVTVVEITGDPFAMIVPFFAAPEPVPGEVTGLTFTVVCALPRDAALERRDDIIAHLRAIGVRLSIQSGTNVTLADAGVATLGDIVTGGPGEPR
jgi:hypothetical protein